MKYRTFGRLGWQVSEIGFGAWALGGSWGPQDDSESVAALHAALDLGCNFIDTALAYGDGRSERVIARVLRERSGVDRIFVATKIPPAPGAWPPGPRDLITERFPAAYLRAKVEESLRNLQTDCLDLLQLHTWTRAWNRDPSALETLRELQREGKILGIGISTPEPDQNALNDLIRDGWLDAVQVIYNVFEQDPAAELLPLAAEHKVGVIVRVALDEGSLTGKFTAGTQFIGDDHRQRYFAGDRLARTVARVEKIRAVVGDHEPDLATAALKFALKPAAVSTVIAGMRNPEQARRNCAVGDLPPISDDLEQALFAHQWRRGQWYDGK
jgi:aryl-alcohol dehydrogenase-like predicted oxidoreductase